MMSNEQLLEKIHLVVEKLMNLGGSDYGKDRTVSRTDTKKALSRGILGSRNGTGLRALDYTDCISFRTFMKTTAICHF